MSNFAIKTNKTLSEILDKIQHKYIILAKGGDSMKIKKILFSILLIVLFMGLLNSCNGEERSNDCLNFTYNEINYNIDVGKIAKENNINIADYPYYIIAKPTTSSISIYYSKERIVSKKRVTSSGYDYIYGSNSALKIDINGEGSVSGNIIDFSERYLTLYSNRFIASNHDIFYNTTVVYNRNHGYEYDSSKENEKACNETMRVTTDTKVFEKAAINYNEIATLSSGDIVRRTAYSVNTVNGHTWDKIVLNNGSEGYVFADNLETASEYENINFKYDNKTYDVYFLPSKYGINITDYPYYVIGKNTSSISIYYSKERIVSKHHITTYGSYDHLYGSKSALHLSIQENGSISGKIVDLSSNYYILYTSKFIASNQDIFYGSTVVHNRNHGLEYNSSQEKDKLCDDIMRVSTDTKVFEKAAMNYNEITTLSSGDVVKRTAHSVNTVNGHTWDKIVLNNGSEGYVFADNLETANEYENINFEYGNKTYNVYFSPSKYRINITDYPYYVIGKNLSSISIYYSKERIVSKHHIRQYGNYDYLYGSNTALHLSLQEDGSVSGRIVDMSSNYYMLYADKFVASNHDILYNGTVIHNRNHGYDYTVNGYTFTLNKSESSLQNETKTAINIGENEYGKMDPVLIDQNLEKLESTENTLNLLCSVGSVLETAGPALSRYQSNTGEFLHHQKGSEMFSSSPKALSKLVELESAAIVATERMSFESTQFNFALGEETGIQLENIDLMNKGLGELIQEYVTSIEKLDWYLAFGYVRIELICDVKKVDGKTVLTATYNVNDYYDWDKNSTDKIFGMVTQQELWQLHNAGVAKNFNQEATYVRVLEWNTGDISSARVTSEFSK